MTLEEKQTALGDVLDCAAEALTPGTPLDTLGWDSMARVTLIAVARTRFNVRISGSELKSFQTVGDVFAALDRPPQT